MLCRLWGMVDDSACAWLVLRLLRVCYGSLGSLAIDMVTILVSVVDSLVVMLSQMC